MYGRRYRIKKYLKENREKLDNVDNVVFVRCKALDEKTAGYVKALLGQLGITVSDLWYIENSLKEEGIKLVLRKRYARVGKDFYAIGIRGNGKAYDSVKLYHVSKSIKEL